MSGMLLLLWTVEMGREELEHGTATALQCTGGLGARARHAQGYSTVRFFAFPTLEKVTPLSVCLRTG